MIRFFFVCIGFFFVSCSLDRLDSCLEHNTNEIVQTINVPDFSKLNVSQGIQVEIIQHPIFKIEIAVGEKFQKYIEFNVVNHELFLKNNLTCTLGYTKPAIIKVFTPNLTDIYSNSQFNLYSKQTLNFPSLRIAQGITKSNASCVFTLQIVSEHLVIETNNLSSFLLSGKTNHLAVRFFGGGARIQAQNLLANHITIFHRSTNHMYLNAAESIKGTIYGNGNVYLKEFPKVVEVSSINKGKLIKY